MCEAWGDFALLRPDLGLDMTSEGGVSTAIFGVVTPDIG